MLDIKEHLSKIRSEVGEEMASKIAANLNSIDIAYTDLSNNRKSIDEARVKYRDRSEELTKEIETLQGKVVALGNDETVSELTAKIEKLEGFQTQVFKENRAKFGQMFEGIQASPAFDKVKPYLELPEPKDDKYDFTNLSDEAINKNYNEGLKLQSLGLFETKPNVNIPPKAVPHGVVAGSEASMSELAKTNPEAYAEKRKEIKQKVWSQ